ncbi:SHOCT domain-containing protein [Flavobacterium rhamnosiphilum]|uniref:SHOCT domain-containing protein n=1 Tax=Flavobacterium rhamnosiphilum TaxID=2541724 RepID=A0A4R5FB55_9FLAO|nr:SHOCT domain-containing protein [Flavobacterium rhamnosiphilum]
MGYSKKRFARGEITKEEFEEKKIFLTKIKPKNKLLYVFLNVFIVVIIILFLF